VIWPPPLFRLYCFRLPLPSFFLPSHSSLLPSSPEPSLCSLFIPPPRSYPRSPPGLFFPLPFLPHTNPCSTYFPSTIPNSPHPYLCIPLPCLLGLFHITFCHSSQSFSVLIPQVLSYRHPFPLPLHPIILLLLPPPKTPSTPPASIVFTPLTCVTFPLIPTFLFPSHSFAILFSPLFVSTPLSIPLHILSLFCVLPFLPSSPARFSRPPLIIAPSLSSHLLSSPPLSLLRLSPPSLCRSCALELRIFLPYPSFLRSSTRHYTPLSLHVSFLLSRPLLSPYLPISRLSPLPISFSPSLVSWRYSPPAF